MADVMTEEEQPSGSGEVRKRPRSPSKPPPVLQVTKQSIASGKSWLSLVASGLPLRMFRIAVLRYVGVIVLVS